MIQWLIKHQITNNKKKQQVMEEGKKKWKNQSIVIVNRKATDKTYNVRSSTARAKIEKRGKEDNINSELAQEENSDISNRDVCPLCNRPVKTGVECGICSRSFHYKCEGTTEERVHKEYPHETHCICKKDKEQKELKVAIREEKRTEVEAKYKNLQKIHESIKK